MESFFLAETTKYLYLLFDPENPLNSNGGSGTIIDTPRGQCLIEAGGYIFNTEAHPVDTAALRCCHDEMRNPLAGYEPDRFGDRFKWSQREDTASSEAVGVTNAVSAVEDHSRITTTIIDVDTDAAKEARDKIVAEIMSVMKEGAKYHNDEVAVVEEPVSNENEVNSSDDSIIMSVGDIQTTDGFEQASDDLDPSTGIGEAVPLEPTNDIITIEDPVEVVKLPPTRDPDDKKSTTVQPTTTAPVVATPNEQVVFDEETSSAEIPPTTTTTSADFLSTEFQQDRYLADMAAKENVTNMTDFLQSILKSALPSVPRFDAQQLLQKIRANDWQRNTTQPNYRWLTCRAQPFLHRISIMGEFF